MYAAIKEIVPDAAFTIFTGDIIEGKSAGNVILARGRPGVGKTLTAEVYAEVIGKPLYSIHTGSLGITAELVRQNLEVDVILLSRRELHAALTHTGLTLPYAHGNYFTYCAYAYLTCCSCSDDNTTLNFATQPS